MVRIDERAVKLLQIRIILLGDRVYCLLQALVFASESVVGTVAAVVAFRSAKERSFEEQ